MWPFTRKKKEEKLPPVYIQEGYYYVMHPYWVEKFDAIGTRIKKAENRVEDIKKQGGK